MTDVQIIEVHIYCIINELFLDFVLSCVANFLRGLSSLSFLRLFILDFGETTKLAIIVFYPPNSEWPASFRIFYAIFSGSSSIDLVATFFYLNSISQSLAVIRAMLEIFTHQEVQGLLRNDFLSSLGLSFVRVYLK